MIREVLLVGHRQAVAWIDEWHGMTLDDVRKYEKEMQQMTNTKVQKPPPTPPALDENSTKTPTSSVSSEKDLIESPKTPKSKSWFGWS